MTTTMTRNEYRALADRKPAEDLTLPELVREYAELKAWFAANETRGRHPEGNARHDRLGAVVGELRLRHALD